MQAQGTIFLSPYFVTNAEKMVAELEDPYILVHEKKAIFAAGHLPILEAVVQGGKPQKRASLKSWSSQTGKFFGRKGGQKIAANAKQRQLPKRWQ
jgi:hypothetical protein